MGAVENKKGMHTFIVLTDNEADAYIDAINVPAILKQANKEAKRKAREEIEAARLAGKKPEVQRVDIKELMKDKLRQLKWNLETRPVNEQEINVDSLEKLAEIRESIINF